MIALLFGLLGLAYLTWQLQPASLGVFSYRYDEGVYAQTAWALQRGHALYTEVFSAQPPLAPYLLAGLFQVTGPSIAAARVLMVVLSLAVLGAVALLARRGAGWPAGLGAVILLALSPQFMLEARTVSPEIPALALMNLALGLAVYLGRTRSAWWLAVGLLAALASLAKLSALVIAPALPLLLLERHWPRPRYWSSIARDLVLLAAPALLLWGLLLTQVDRTELIDQLITYHTSARAVWRLSITSNLSMVVGAIAAYPPPWILAVVGVAALWQRRQRLLLVTLLIVVVATLAALLTHTPLWPHHLVLILPPIAVLGGVGLEAALTATSRLRWARPRSARDLTTLVPVAALGCALALVPHVIAMGSRILPDATASWAGPDRAVAALLAVPDEAGFVLTDDQLAAFIAGKRVPPALVDTSYVRIETGYLDAETVVRAAEPARPAAILFWSGRLYSIRGLRRWVRQHYQLAQPFGREQELYLPH